MELIICASCVDEETDFLRKEKVLPVWKEIGPTLGLQAAYGSEKLERVKKPKKAVKQITSAIYNDVSWEDILTDQNEVRE